MKGRITNNPEETIERITSMYVKWQDLPYESATWETEFPNKEDPLYPEFLKAYGTYLSFRDVELPRPPSAVLNGLDKPRPQSQFKEITKQPDYITLGTLMDFQLLGVSWLVSAFVTFSRPNFVETGF